MTASPPLSVVLVERIDLSESSNSVIIVTINRPKQLNCFNTDVILSLAKVFSEIADENDEDLAAGESIPTWVDLFFIAAFLFMWCDARMRSISNLCESFSNL